MAVAAIAFSPVRPEQSPNVRRASVESVVATYHHAMTVAFASYRRWSPEVTLRLVTDLEPPAEHAEGYARLGVDVLLEPFAHRPPEGFAAMFTASLYTLDAMHALGREHPAEPVALLDPDCLAVRSLDPLLARAAKRICAYPMTVPSDRVVNGLSGLQASTLHQRLDPSLDGVPQAYGGECYAFTADALAPVLDRAESALRLSLTLPAGEPRFVTEEHLFNFALRRADVNPIDDLLKRIWTAPRLRTVDGSESRLALWHLPAEKDRGFRGMVEVVLDRTSWFWTASADEHRARLGRRMGVTRRPPPRWSYDTIGRTVRVIQRTVRPTRG